MVVYCTYLTVYKGNKLPPFYIGYSTVDKVNKGYNGSVSSKEYKQIWKLERKIHPKLFKTVILSTHSTNEEAILKEAALLNKLKVIDNSLYINKAAFPHFNSIGRKHSEETKKKISSGNKGKKRSIEVKQLWSQLKKGKTSPRKGVKLSEETKKKLSEAKKTFYKYNKHPRLGTKYICSEETKEKIRQAVKKDWQLRKQQGAKLNGVLDQ